MKEYLEARIEELKEADKNACKNRWDESNTESQRHVWREVSNEVTARRRELENALHFLITNT